ERPIIELIGALQSLGVEIKYTEKDGFPPLNIKGSTLKGGKITIDGAVSSQFISALLMIAPILKNGITLIIEGKIVSKPYIEMTLNLMQEFGVLHSWNGNKIEIKPQKYVAKNIAVEADWSAAAFWFEIAALSNSCNIKLNGLKQNSMQGDKKAVEIFDDLVVDSTFENGKLILIKKERWISPFKTYDLIETPDLYQPLRCTLFSKDIDGNFSGIQTLEDKETDRVSAVETELKKLTSSKIIETYKDHRMAMSFAPLSLKFGEIQINNAEVVSKSYPNFWKDLEKGGFKIFPLTDSNN
ncbi:MAG TPA: 3-phosphoshikimate 1-carboxyvinyltransferase, partial [Flavobacteriales bacterium]|nr:3-phosphoshikimate 1-carboxyvinyltransferase [Flavobacteriales bacterium]